VPARDRTAQAPDRWGDIPRDVRRDAVLIEAARGGDRAAYGVLYERHLGAARRIAGLWAASPAEREDVIAEAFTRVLRALRSRGGSDELFGPYLVATMRNAVISWRRRDSAVSLVAEVPEPPGSGRGAGTDPIDEHVHASLAADAFATLPERWRMVLWHTEIADESPTQIAQLLGMTSNSVSALAYRHGLGCARRTWPRPPKHADG
jgi:RNA polymerase sigma factor (sigma-70 family)